MTKDQILAFTEINAISNGDYDTALNESDLAIKFGINVEEVEILTEARILE
jgi:plasmid maintenance system antidote protein VapI